MSDEVQKPPKKRPRVWPGMPTRGSQMFESFFPLITMSIVIVVLVLFSLRSCIGS